MTPDQRHQHRLRRLGDFFDTFEQLGDFGLIATGTRKVDGHAAGAFPGERYYLAVFIGKAVKPALNAFGFYESEASRAEAIERVRRSLATHAEAKAKRREERRQPHSLAVGQVLLSSWGYEQTNVDFYEVVAVRGAVVDIRKLAASTTNDSDMTGHATPVPGQYVSDVIRSKRPDARNSVRLNSHCIATPWNGKPARWTSYA
jgi:hypothetical protein